VDTHIQADPGDDGVRGEQADAGISLSRAAASAKGAIWASISAISAWAGCCRASWFC
jgi:hypothetical protein